VLSRFQGAWCAVETSRNLPIVVCFHNFAMIRTCIHPLVTSVLDVLVTSVLDVQVGSPSGVPHVRRQSSLCWNLLFAGWFLPEFQSKSANHGRVIMHYATAWNDSVHPCTGYLIVAINKVMLFWESHDRIVRMNWTHIQVHGFETARSANAFLEYNNSNFLNI